MPIVPVKCTQCGGSLEVDSAHEAAVCSYCKQAFIVEKARELALNSQGAVMFCSADFTIEAGLLRKYSGEATEVDIPEGVQGIGHEVFANRRFITTITIPRSVKEISGHNSPWYSAFYNCSGLTTISIPEGVTILDFGVFQGCSGLASITLPSSLKTIDADAFEGCSRLKDITIPDSVSRIGGTAFKGCSSLESISIPEGVDRIEGKYSKRWGGMEYGGTFENCSSLTTVSIPNSVTSIGQRAFNGCSNLTTVLMPESVTTIEEEAFRGCASLKEISLHEGLQRIGRRAFEGCASLVSVKIPASIEYIPSGAFCGCTGLVTIVVTGDAKIASGAFGNCASLREMHVTDKTLRLLPFYDDVYGYSRSREIGEVFGCGREEDKSKYPVLIQIENQLRENRPKRRECIHCGSSSGFTLSGKCKSCGCKQR